MPDLMLVQWMTLARVRVGGGNRIPYYSFLIQYTVGVTIQSSMHTFEFTTVYIIS